MTSMKDCSQVEVTGDADAVTSEYVENTIENPAWYTVEDNHVSLVSENVEKVTKFETDVLDDCVWENRVEITKHVDNQSNMELPLEYQDVTDNIYLNPRNTSDILFHCNICGKSFVLNYLLKNHLAEHKKQVHYKTNKCKFCGKQFKLKFGLNRHIEKYHNPMCAKIVSTALSIVRDTPYFCIRKSSNIEHGFCNDNYEQTPQNKLIFTCRICKNPPSTDKHSFALHMSEHRECSMHECVVCDETFNSVALWIAHMTDHQQQIDLNVSTVQFNLLESKSNKEENNTDSTRMSRNQKKETNISSIKKTNFCNLCNRKFTKRCYFTNHMMMKHNINTNTPKQLTSIDCNESESDNTELLNDIKNIELERANDIKNKLLFPVNNKNNNMNNHVNKINEKKSTFCTLCNKHFAHLGALTNHMRIHVEHPCDLCEKKFSTRYQLNFHQKSHSKLKIESTNHQDKIKCQYCKKECDSISQWKMHMSMSNECINTNTPKQLTSIDCNESESDNTELLNDIKNIELERANDIKNKLLFPVNNKNNNLNNHVNKNNEKKSKFCKFCNKHFAYSGALSNHMRIHAYKQWFPCDVCDKKFSTPFQLIVHRKSHSEIVPYVCRICNKSFQFKYRWNCHLKSHYKKEDTNLKTKQHTNNLKSNISNMMIESLSHQDKIKCRYCKKECDSISQWKTHMSMSNECRRHCKSYIPEFTSNKTVLDKTYLNTYDNTGSQKDILMDINQQKPAIKKRNRSNHINGAKCELCGKIYSNGYNLTRHISMVHKQTFTPMTCKACGITFKDKFSYGSHLRNKHNQLFKHYEGTNSTDNRTSGQIISVNKKNIMKYICEICKMTFADNITLQKHTKIHTLNMFKCNDCGQQFETRLSLSNHTWENHSAT